MAGRKRGEGGQNGLDWIGRREPSMVQEIREWETQETQDLRERRGSPGTMCLGQPGQPIAWTTGSKRGRETIVREESSRGCSSGHTHTRTQEVCVCVCVVGEPWAAARAHVEAFWVKLPTKPMEKWSYNGQPNLLTPCYREVQSPVSSRV